jgi:hypothetical protein
VTVETKTLKGWDRTQAVGRRWEAMRLEYFGEVGDLMRGATGSRRDTTNCGSRKMNVGQPC